MNKMKVYALRNWERIKKNEWGSREKKKPREGREYTNESKELQCFYGEGHACIETRGGQFEYSILNWHPNPHHPIPTITVATWALALISETEEGCDKLPEEGGWGGQRGL